MKIIIPAVPSDYARPYPELVLAGTAEQMRDLANVLSGLDRNNPKGICARVTGKPGGQLLIKAIESALDDYAYITGYLGAYRGYDLDEDHETLESMRAAIRAKWVDHIERSIWKQLGSVRHEAETAPHPGC